MTDTCFYSQWRKPLVRALHAEGVTTWEQLAALPAITLLTHKGVSARSLDFTVSQLRGRGLRPLLDAPQPPPSPEKHRPVRPTSPAIYFVQCGDYVKIGLTTNIRRRLKHVGTFATHPLVVLHLVPCAPDADLPLIEAEFHQQFKRLHHHGEWFRYEGELRAFLEAQAKP